MSEWKEYTIEDICEQIFAGGDAAKYRTTKYQTSLYNIPVYANSTEDDGLYGYCDKAVVSSPAVTIAARGAGIGFVAFRNKPFVPIVRLITLITNNSVDTKFLYYYLKNRRLSGDGSAIPQITVPMVKKETVIVPILEEQKRIVNILSSLDEKIETNRKINARLEELAQALFKSWFIDFEPFGGKMPEDWKIVKMSEVIEDIAAGPFGSKLPKACFTSEGTPIIDGANLKERIVDETFSKFVSPSKSNELGRAVAHRNDFVVTISGTIGQIAYIYGTSKFSDYLVSQRQFRFSLKKDKVNKHYISLLFANNIGKQKILSFGNQVGVPALSQPLKNFKNVEIILPGMIIQNSFGEIIESIDSLICKNKQESARLTEMRDTLLPKLMSGELIPE